MQAELAGLAVVAIGLLVVGQRDYIVVWFALVVAVHFLPLARLYAAALLSATGAVFVAGAVAGLVVGPASSTAPVTVTGLIVGLTLAAAAALTLIRVRGQLSGGLAP